MRSSSEVRELTLSTAIREFAASAILLFEPIYLYTQGLTIAQIMFFYAVSYFFYLFLIPLGGKFIRAHGYEHGIIFSTPFLVFYYAALYAVSFTPWALAAAVVFNGLFKMLYWAGFHADFARFGSAKGGQGREISVFAFAASLAAILGPLAGGAVLTSLGFPALFLMVSVLLIVSNFPLMLTPERFEPRTLSYPDAWKRLARPENRTKVLAFFGYGEELIAMTVWPIFMFVIVPGFVELGAIGSIATLAGALMTLAIGRLTDESGRHRMLRVGAVLSVLTWLLRFAATTPAGVLFSHALSRSARSAVGIPLIALTYEYARSYSVTKTALFLEMSVVVGKLLAAIGCLLVVILFAPGWQVIFGFGALLSLLYLYGNKAFP